MAKILIAGAGGTPSENVILSLLACEKKETVIGMGSEESDLYLSNAEKKFLIPYAIEPSYKQKLEKLLKAERPDLVHFQNDIEILEASRIREEILGSGAKLFMPSHDVIENCVDKSKSAAIWQSSGVRVPKTLDILTRVDLKRAFDQLANAKGEIWLRANVGGGGRGALPTDDFDFAAQWIDRFQGWGEFTAAELLSEKTVTWLSIWFEGELIVAQTRKRHAWNLGNRTLSGVTGVTKVGETFSSEVVNRVALDAVLAIDKRPHGIYGVDMTYDWSNVPNPTEINISRFFTTVNFFTEAGLNMPKIFKDIALYAEFPSLEKKFNPLPDGLMWLRGMDCKPKITTAAKMKAEIVAL